MRTSPTTSSTRACAIAAILLLASPGLTGIGEPGAAHVHWRRASFAPGDWPDGLPDATRQGVLWWSEWARGEGYRIDVDESGGVLMLSETRFNRSVRREEELVADTLAAFDQLVAGPDDESPRGAASGRSPSSVVALVRLHDEADYQSLLNHLSTREPRLSPWAAGARAGAGAMLWSPPAALWIEDALGRAGWRGENELVHRLATALVRARFGSVPPWLEAGVAWELELEVCSSIHALPGGAGPAALAEHKGWDRSLRKTFADRAGAGLDAAGLAAWAADGVDERQASLAWGFVAFLADHRPGVLGHVLGDLAQYHAATSTSRDDAAWAGQPEPEIPVSVQDLILRRWAGDDVFTECARRFEEGSRYRPRAR